MNQKAIGVAIIVISLIPNRRVLLLAVGLCFYHWKTVERFLRSNDGT